MTEVSQTTMLAAQAAGDLDKPRDNATLIEQRGHAMMLDHLRGMGFEAIARRYGVTDPQVVEDLIYGAIDDAIARRDHNDFQASAFQELLILDIELKELDEEIKPTEELTRQVLTPQGKVETLKEQTSRVLEKVKIKGERRQNVLARKAVLGIQTGEGGATNGDDMQAIKNAVMMSARTVLDKVIPPLIQQSQEVGRLKERQDSAHDVEGEP